MVELTMTELMAERLYNLFRLGRMGEISFIQNYINLAYRDDTTGIMYLTWLLSKSKKKVYKKIIEKSNIECKNLINLRFRRLC